MPRRVKDTIKFIVGFPSYFLAGILLLLLFLPLRFRSRRRQARGVVPNLFWGTASIGNLRFNARAPRLVGYVSHSVVFDHSFLNSPGDFDYSFHRFSIPPLRWFIPPWVLLWAVCKYDIFNCYFDGGILSGTAYADFEFVLLKALGKKVVRIGYGGDVILPSKSSNVANLRELYTAYFSGLNEEKKKRHLKKACDTADFVIVAGEQIAYVPRYDLCYEYYCIDASEWPVKIPDPSDTRPVKIVHASNHRSLKGTEALIQACNELKHQGYALELIIVENKSNRDAKNIYLDADIIADQFILGYFALFALEGMAMGKPVLCFLKDDFAPYHPEWKYCPIVNTPLGAIKERIRDLIQNPEKRAELGRRGRWYVETFNDLAPIGRLFDKIYQKIWWNRPIPMEPWDPFRFLSS